MSRPVARTRPTRRGDSGIAGGILVAAGLMLGVGVVFAGIYLSTQTKKGLIFGQGNRQSGEIVKQDYNFAFPRPFAGWANDVEAQNELDVNVLAYQREGDSHGWIALAVRDFGSREPQPTDLKERMMSHLFRGFDNLPPELSTEAVTVDGKPAEKATFRAVYRKTGDTCVGEALIMNYKGIGYWIYTWAPERDLPVVEEELDEYTKKFRLLELRENWAPTRVPEQVHRSKSGLFRITDYERLWIQPKGREPTDEDEKGELVLESKLKTGVKRDFYPTAYLVVIVTDADGDARKYVEDRYAIFDDVKFEEIEGELIGDVPNSGPMEPALPVQRLKVVRGGEGTIRTADKYVLFASIKTDDHLIIAEASCPYREREVWEKRLAQIVGSLRE